MTQVGSTGHRRQPPPNHGHHRSHDHRQHHRHRQARSGRLLGEASAVTFHFVWVHQEKFNQPYVEAMGKFWRACNARTEACACIVVEAGNGKMCRSRPRAAASRQQPRRVQPRRGGQAQQQLPPHEVETETEREEEDEEVASDVSVRWADVQVDEAERRVHEATNQLSNAKRELANRRLLFGALSEANELRASAAQAEEQLGQRAAEAAQRRSDAALACEQAKLAVKRKLEAQQHLKAVQARQRAATEAASELQQSLSSSSGSEGTSEEY